MSCLAAACPQQSDRRRTLANRQPLSLNAANQDDLDEDLVYCFKDTRSLGQILQLTHLQHLNVAFNALPNLKGIQALPHLQLLNVSHNQLTSIQAVSALQGLTQLICSHNRIHNTEPLTGLQSLQFLALHNNTVSRAADVLALSRLTCLKHLTLCHNPVCMQVDCWERAIIGALAPSLEALDSTIITPEQRDAAAACSGAWAAVGEQLEARCPTSSCSSSSTSCAASDGAHRASSSNNGCQDSRGLFVSSRSSSSSSAGRLRPRVSDAGSASIKDATSLLPTVVLQPLKPSTLIRKPSAQAPTHSKYGYSRAKPITVLEKQMYPASGSTAVTIHSDGSSNLTWPEGSMAVTLIPEDPPAAGSIASSTSSNAAASTVAPIKGYRLLAMYRNVTGVAASFDSSGGFAQWPNGQLMLVWNKLKREGRAYNADGTTSCSFKTRRQKPPGALKEDIAASLDEHLSIRFVAGSNDVEVTFNCEGCRAVLSQQHGAVLAERAAGDAPPPKQPTQAAGAGGLASSSSAATAADDLQPPPAAAAEIGRSEGGGGGGGDQMQALLARARALMAATDLTPSTTLSSSAATAAEVSQAGTVERAPDLLEATPDDDDAQRPLVGVAADDLQAMMARARAAVAALQMDL